MAIALWSNPSGRRTIIRNQSGTGLGLASTTTLPRQALHKHTGVRKKSTTPSASKIAAYAGAFLLLVAVVAVGYESPQKLDNQVAAVGANAVSPVTAATEEITPSVDQVVATDVAADLASRANLPIATNVVNMSISLAAKNELAQTDASAITKPQIIQPNASRSEIISYKAVKGDSVPSLATKFGVSLFFTYTGAKGVNLSRKAAGEEAVDQGLNHGTETIINGSNTIMEKNIGKDSEKKLNEFFK